MDTVQFAELDVAIRCGQFAWLQKCLCQQPDPVAALQQLTALLSNADVRKLKLINKMLCGCAINPQPVQNTCLRAMTDWVRNHETAFNTIQNLLAVASSTGLPIIDQAVSVLVVALEQIEDAAARDDNTLLEDAAQTVCQAAVRIERVRLDVIGQLPASLRNLADLLTSLQIANLLESGCCGNNVQLPSTPTTPQLPPAATPASNPPAAQPPAPTVPVSTTPPAPPPSTFVAPPGYRSPDTPIPPTGPSVEPPTGAYRGQGAS